MLRTYNFCRNYAIAFGFEFFLAVLALVLAAAPAAAQVPDPVAAAQAPQPGSDHSYIGTGAETVNPADGSVTFNLPIKTPPGRQLNLPFRIRYSFAETWAMGGGQNGEFSWQQAPLAWWGWGGWSWDVPNLTWRSVVAGVGDVCTASGKSGCTNWAHLQMDAATDFVFRGLDGQPYTLMLGGGPWPDSACSNQLSQCTTNNGGYNSSPSNLHGIYASFATSGDSTPLGATTGWPGGSATTTAVTVVDQGGTTYQFLPSGGSTNVNGSCCAAGSLATSITDRNGNTITLDSNGYIDTLGRPVVSWTGLGNPNGDTISISGLGAVTVKWTTVNVNGYQMGSKVLSGGWPTCTVPSWGPSGLQPVVSEIDLPNNTKYTFSYNSTYGTIASIGFPDGGSVRYNWGLDPLSQGIFQLVTFNTEPTTQEECAVAYDAPAVTERIVNDGTQDVLDQIFSYATSWGATGWTSKTTTVTTTDLVTQPHLVTITKYTYYPQPVDTTPYSTNSRVGVAPVETSVEYEDGSGTMKEQVNQEWLNYMTASGSQTVLDNGQTRTTLKCFNSDEQPTQVNEYGLPSEGSAGSAPSCYNGTTGLSDIGPLERQTATTYYDFMDASPSTHIVNFPSSIVVSDGSGTPWKQTELTPTNAVNPSNITPTVTVSGTTYTILGSPPSLVSGKPGQRGNVGQVQRWVNNTDPPLPTNYSWYDTGQMNTMQDPKGNTTTYNFSAAYEGAYLTQVIFPPLNTGPQENFTWYPSTGELASSEDMNSQTTNYTYNDPLNRLTLVTHPTTPLAYYNGSTCSSAGQTSYSYTDTPGSVSVATTKLLCNGTPASTSTAYLNGLGLTTKAIAENGAETDTTYDGSRHVYQVSNPSFSTTNCSTTPNACTTTLYDALGRVTSVTEPDQSVVTTSYAGACATVKDEETHSRTSCTDGLGRIWQVTEDPGGFGYVTTYEHDPNDNLTLVSQNSGGQTRSFLYDWLSRMYSATNPESGTTTYTYPVPGAICSGDASDACTRTDNRGITTTYTYNDALNRLTSKTYSDGTPTASFFYDESSVTLGSWTSPTLGYPIGRQTHTTTTSGGTTLTATVESYDPMGRTASYWQCTPVNCGSSSLWGTSYTYDLAGDVSTWTHPAGFTITQNLNTAQQVTQVISSMSGPTYPATLASGPGGGSNPIQYTPWGAVASLQNGCAPSGSCAAAQESYAYNNRLQMVTAQLTSGSYSSCRVYNFYVSNLTGGVPNPTGCTTTPQQGTNNNGNVGGLYYSDSGGLGHTATYQYDAVNRLWNAWATGSVAYSQTFSYDAYGNMSCSASPAEPQCLATTYNTNNNQINYITSNTVNTSYQYDPAGDLQTDGTNTYQWDAEGHLAAVYMNLNGSLVSMNTYNALGQRVEDMTPSSTTDEAYGADGSLLARYTGDSNSRSFVPFNGRILAEYYCGGLIFDHPDEIGSATTSTDCTGSNVQERLYLPFGEFWTGAGSLGMHQEFARLPDYDPETDQYNTLARHYSPSGRWMSPDWSEEPEPVPYANLEDPQTLNLYGYVRNNPVTSVDEDGHVEAGIDVDVGMGEVDKAIAYLEPAPEVGASALATFGAVIGAAGGVLVIYSHESLIKNQANLKMQEQAAINDLYVRAQKQGLPKPATGPGSVPPDQRDPKRSLTPKENKEQIKRQGGTCPQCGKPIKKGDAHHTPVRHSDGGTEMKVVHKKCHKQLHSGCK